MILKHRNVDSSCYLEEMEDELSEIELYIGQIDKVLKPRKQEKRLKKIGVKPA